MWLRPQDLHLFRPLKRHAAECRDEIHHQEDGRGVQEEIVKIFVENYSLFVGINVYLPQIIVRIFVDFD